MDFPLDFHHAFIVLLPLVTRTLESPANSKQFALPYRLFSVDIFLYSHVCQYVTNQNKRWNAVQNFYCILFINFCYHYHFFFEHPFSFFFFLHYRNWGPSVYNGNRTEWSPIQSVIIQVMNKIGPQRSCSLICQSRVWLLTELDDTKSCYQLIITLTIEKIKLN